MRWCGNSSCCQRVFCERFSEGGSLILAVAKPVKILKKAFGKFFGKKADSPCPLSCFVAGTLVLTKNGYANIEDLNVGESVWATDVSSGESAWKPTTHTWTVDDKDIYQVTIENEEGLIQTIDATESHPFYVVGSGWVNTVELIVGDLFMDKDQGILTVKSVVELGRKDTAYNFSVADFHTHYVTEKNILVHNCGGVTHNQVKAGIEDSSKEQSHHVVGVSALQKTNHELGKGTRAPNAPAIKMSKSDHAALPTTEHNAAGNAIRAKQVTAIEQNNFRKAMAIGVKEIRAVHGRKFNDGIKAAINTCKSGGNC